MTQLAKREILKEGIGAFNTRRCLVHREAGFEVAGSGVRPCGESWGSLIVHRDGTTGGQWFKTLAEAEAHYLAMTTPIEEVSV